MTVCVGFWSLLYLTCIWFLHYSARASCCDSFTGTRAGSVIVRTMIYSAVWCVTVPWPRHRAGYRFGVMMWYGLCYDWRWCVCDIVICSEMYGDLNTSGVWCVVAPASGGDHVPEPYAWFLFAFCIFASRTGLTRYICICFCISLTPVMLWITVLSALHTQYLFRTDPLSSGGCVSCRAGTGAPRDTPPA